MTSPITHRPADLRFDIALVVVAAISQILVSFLSMLGIGTPIGANSDAVSTLVTQAGWAFSIWGALYLGALVFGVASVSIRLRPRLPCELLPPTYLRAADRSHLCGCSLPAADDSRCGRGGLVRVGAVRRGRRTTT